MAILSKSTFNQHIRSVSLPSTSHPITLRIQDVINTLQSVPLSANTISNNLSQFNDLYKCLDNLINLPLTQQALSKHRKEKWVDRLLDGSMKILDICGSTMDLVSQMKENLGDVRSCIRRRKGDSSIKSSIIKFTSYRKKMNKDAKRLVATLKKIEYEIEVVQILDLDHHMLEVIKVLEEVSGVSVSMFESVLAFLSVPISKPNQKKWSLVSNLMCKSHLDDVNELQRVDAALLNLYKYGSNERENMLVTQNRLDLFAVCVEEIESNLGCTFRHLIRIRSSFLNNVSS